MSSPSRCVILVPVGGQIVPPCEMALQVLEQRGYPVRRVWGHSAIDLGRSTMASHALDDGFDELLWIDADIGFHPDAVEKLRGHDLPIVCGIYAKKSAPEFACEFLRSTKQIVFGTGGGLAEIRYAGCGFLHTRRVVYERMRERLALPVCNQHFGRPIVPYFLPFVVPHRDGHWYLPEDYAFCERARQCEIKVLADTSIRLEHIGTYRYTWEDIGRRKEPIGTYTCNFNWQTRDMREGRAGMDRPA